MITEVRVRDTSEVLFRKDVPAGTATHIHDDVPVAWVGQSMDGTEFWITLKEPAKVSKKGGRLIVEKLPPEPEWVDVTKECRVELRPHEPWEENRSSLGVVIDIYHEDEKLGFFCNIGYSDMYGTWKGYKIEYSPESYSGGTRWFKVFKKTE